MSLSNAVVSPQQISLRNVLVATDFAAASSLPLLYALSLVRRYGATLYLAHVVRPDPLRRADTASLRAVVDQAWREGQRLTTDLLVSGELRGVPHKLLIGEGEIWDGLAIMVQDNSIDLIVSGTRGRTGLSKMLFGSVAEQIFRQAPCPVITVGPNAAAPSGQALERILYATDFTPQSLHAASYALSLAQHYQARLWLLHVLAEGASAGPASLAEEEARIRLTSIIGGAGKLAINAEVFAGRGAAGQQILHFAERQSAQLIVLGVTHPGQGPFAGRRWNVASEVAGRAVCPVLTVRAPSGQ